MNINRRLFCFVSILIIATFLRFWELGKVPASVDWDEAALGYNAYSLLKTGKDEYGTKFPLVIRSFDDYKPPLYTYITIPAVAVFGLNPWSVRLPSAIAGVLAVVGTYFFVVELLKKRIIGYWKLDIGNSKIIALLSAMLLAISPWHIQFSRIAFEANTGVTLTIWACLAFLRGLQSKYWFCISALLASLAVYSYHSERIFIPLFGIVLLFVFRSELLKKKKEIFIAGIILFLTILPAVPVFLNSTALMRLRGTSSLADQTGLLARTVKKIEFDFTRGDRVGALFDNRRFVWMKTLLDGYISHYSLKWLFLTGDNARHHAPDMGLLYLWELPFFLLGMYCVAKKGGRAAYILFGWFFISPIAASPTTELPHAIRSLVFLPTFQIFTAVGIVGTLSSVRYRLSATNIRLHTSIIRLCIACYMLFVLMNVTYYLHMYFYHMDYEYSQFWQYGYQQAVEYSQLHKSRYKHIVVSTKLEQPHMFFLFYTKYDPVKYLAGGGTASGGFAEARNKFDIYQFRPIDWNNEVKDSSTLYLGTPTEILSSGLKTIYYLNGKEAIKIADY